MSKNKKEIQNETKKVKSNNNKNLIIIGAILAVIVIAVILLVVLTKKDNNENEPGDNDDNVVVSDEKTIEEEYGFTKEDAINVIKGTFNSDVYEFSATTREDNMYIVTVTNTDTNTKYTYIVDPNDGSFQELIEE